MSNTKKEWAHMSIFEKIMQIFVNCVPLIIVGIVSYVAYGVPVECVGLDQGVNIWCLVHPGSYADVIGMILLWAGAFWLGGIPYYFIPFEDDDNQKWKPITRVAWLCCIAGPALITIF